MNQFNKFLKKYRYQDSDTPHCIWCKKIYDINLLTIEHVGGKVGPDRDIIKLSCLECNAMHGEIIRVFSDLCEYKISFYGYMDYIYNLAKEKRFWAIINNSWFQISINRFRGKLHFRKNPSNIACYKCDSELIKNCPQSKLKECDIADSYFCSKIRSRVFLWRTK